MLMAAFDLPAAPVRWAQISQNPHRDACCETKPSYGAGHRDRIDGNHCTRRTDRAELLAALLALIVIILTPLSTPDTPARHSAEIIHWYAQPAQETPPCKPASTGHLMWRVDTSLPSKKYRAGDTPHHLGRIAGFLCITQPAAPGAS